LDGAAKWGAFYELSISSFQGKETYRNELVVVGKEVLCISLRKERLPLFLKGEFSKTKAFSPSKRRVNLRVKLPKPNIAPENRPSQKETILFQPLIFRKKLL